MIWDKRKSALVALLSLTFLLFACNTEHDPHLAKLRELQHASPTVDAAEAIKNGNLEFIAVHNHQLIMPLNISACLVQRQGYRILSNESFEYMSYYYQLYASNAQTYANWYNFAIVEALEKRGELDCEEIKTE